MKALKDYQVEGQLSIFDVFSLDIPFGKTSVEPLVPTMEKILEPSLKKPVKWLTKMPMFLDLRKGRNGHQPDVSWVTDIVLLGECMTHNSGVSHKEESAYVYSLTMGGQQHQKYYLNLSEKPSIPKPTKLSQILESNPNSKYRLSAKACKGILNRAMRRGKELPKLLQIALERQAATPSKLGGGVDIDSYGKRAGKGALVQTELSGTLGVSQDQTLITGECLNPWDVQSKHIQSENGVAESLYSGECRYGGGESYVMQSITGETAATLNASSGDSPTHSGPSCICFEPGSASRVGGHVYEDNASGSLRANAGDNAQAVCYGISAYDSNSMKSPNPHSGVYEADTSRTLDLNGGNPACNQGGMAVVSYGLDRASFNQGKNAKFGFSVDKELAPSLIAKGPGGY